MKGETGGRNDRSTRLRWPRVRWHSTPLEQSRALTDPGFRCVGVGVLNAEETPVSEAFMEPASQPAPSTSASAAGAPFSMPRDTRSVPRAPAASPASSV